MPSLQLPCRRCSTNKQGTPQHTQYKVITRIGQGFFIAQCQSCSWHSLFRTSDRALVLADLKNSTFPSKVLYCYGCRTRRLLLVFHTESVNGYSYSRALCCCGQEGLYRSDNKLISVIQAGRPLIDSHRVTHFS